MDDIRTGFDMEMEAEEQVVTEEEVKAIDKPRPFLAWELKGKEYKLKLTTQVITKLERQFDAPLMEAVIEKGMPELWVIVAILQGAMLKFQHGMKSEQVANMLDDYFESGKTQIDLLKEVIYPLMYDAGFFTKALLTELVKSLEEIDTAL